MNRLPVELLDEILSLAIALGTITPSEASCICRRWRGFQKLLFKSVKLDPLDDNILDLKEHNHLASYVEELRIIRRSNVPGPSDVDDLPPSFTDFLCSLQNPSSMILCDSRIHWAKVTARTILSFITVFRRCSFRSLEVAVKKPLPSWMLLYGLSIASKLTIHYVGCIVRSLPASRSLVPNQCSLTHLVLFGNVAVQQTAAFCLQVQHSAKLLLQKLNNLVVEYVEAELTFGLPMAPHVETLVIFLGAQLEVFDLHIRSSYIFTDVPPISSSALEHLKSLQHINIRFSGVSISNNTLVSAARYIYFFLDGLLFSSPMALLSLRIDERRLTNPGAEDYSPHYHSFLSRISEQLAPPNKWPRLTSVSALVNIQDGFTEPVQSTKDIDLDSRGLKIVSLLQINACEAGHFEDAVLMMS